MKIGPHRIGPADPCLIVCEISSNHMGDKGRFLDLIRVAADCGADAVKFQHFTPDGMTLDSKDPAFRLSSGPWAGRRLYDLYKEAQTPWEWTEDGFRVAKESGILAFSTAYEPKAVDFLECFEPPCYKVSSFEVTDLPLLSKIASTGRPVILSTGMASEDELEAAIGVLRGKCATVLLHCVSAYPSTPETANLRRMLTLTLDFTLPVGLSDHSLTLAVPLAAVTFGARVLEKHLTLSRNIPSHDAGFSLEPPEFTATVRAIREAEAALSGPGGYAIGPDEQTDARRILVWDADRPAGWTVKFVDLRTARGSGGLSPILLPSLIGTKLPHSVKAGTPVVPFHE